MVSFGYTLSSEEHGPSALVRNARRAEEAGFDFASISDHDHPWVSQQGHSPLVWAVLGAGATERIEVGASASPVRSSASTRRSSPTPPPRPRCCSGAGSS